MYKINKDWSEMTDIEQRKTLAQDVIDQVKAGWVIPQAGYYCLLKVDTKGLQANLQTKESCEVCAMGSLMVASIIKTNEYEGLWNDYDIEDRLSDIFSKGHLRMIEAAFEKDDILFLETIEIESAVDFGYNYANKEERLIAIMENIINDENGKFLSCEF